MMDCPDFHVPIALPQLLKQTADATPMYPRAAAYDGHCASTGGP